MTSQPKTLSRHDVAKLLKTSNPDILKEWETQSREKVAAAKVQSHLALRDSLPEFLDQLALTLECDDPKKLAAANAEVAREHGEDRAKQPEYTLEEVIFEYHILRAVIVTHLETAGTTDSQSRKIIHEFIDRGIGKAAATYAEFEISSKAIQAKYFEEAKIEAERSNQAKSAFLANMSHEIRTPLGAILGFTDLLKEPDLSNEDRNQFLDTITRNGKALTKIIDDILDLAKVESGKLDVENIDLSIFSLIDDVMDVFRERTKAKGIFLRSQFDKNTPARILSDPTRIRQILINVVGNAIKFTEVGGVIIDVRTGQSAGLKTQFIISVKDTGVGISDEEKIRLFQPFMQADNSTTRKYGGTGLGLALSKRLAVALGGDIAIENRVSETGTTFTFTFLAMLSELNVQKSKKIDADAYRTRNENLPLDGIRVLLADDSIDNRVLVEIMLGKEGASVESATNGLEAFRMGMNGTYDVILMDIQMPVMDGYEATRSLREAGYRKPIVALTAHAMAEERARTLAAGCNGHLTKPLNQLQLIETVRFHSKQNGGVTKT